MKIQTTTSYEGSPAQVCAALLSPELARKRAALVKIDDVQHEVSGSTARTSISVSASRLPSKVRNFAKNGAKATITTAVEGKRVTYSVDPHGLPVQVGAVVVLTGEDTTHAQIAAELKVKIPLIGSAIEKKASAYVERFLAKDAALVNEVMGESND